MKFRGHETFYIRKGWLSKGMRCIERKPDAFVSKDVNPMDTFGLGSNMVKSLRYWMQATGLSSEPKSGKRNQTLTEVGQIIFENDRYLEELGTLQLLQYILATQKELASAWFFFFNEFSMHEFSREDFLTALQKYISMEEGESKYALRSLSDDFQCIINTYLPRYKSNPEKISPEVNLECPFGELGLIDIVDKRKKTYKKSIPAAQSLNPYILFAIIVDQAFGRTEINLNELLNAPGNIGKIFNLDTITMLEVLYSMERLGLIRITRTAGLDLITITSDLNYLEAIEQFYQSIKDQELERAV